MKNFSEILRLSPLAFINIEIIEKILENFLMKFEESIRGTELL